MDELTNTNPAEEAELGSTQPETVTPTPAAPEVPAAPVVTAATAMAAAKPATLEELDQLENEYTPQEREDLLKLYEETLADFVSGVVVTGKVLAVNDKEVAVDIGFKSEGTIPVEEFADPKEINVGDNIQVFIDNIEDSDGMLILSKKKADFMRVWEMVNRSYDKGEIIQGRCVRRIKGGIVVDLSGVDAFLPGSQIDVRPIRDFDALIGQTMDFKIVKINNLRKNIVVSHRVLVEEEMKGQREKILEDLQKGQILEGTVKNITDFGVFIDLGGVDGLLHINDLSWGRVAHPSEVVALDEKIKVVVLDFNEDKDRISLGLKQLQPHPWEDVDKKYPVGSVIRGKVVSISDYGAFIELEKGVEGLIHISEMSWTQHIKHPSKVLSVGEMVDAKVLNIMKEERKISLGLKQLEPDPWQTLSERYPVGSRHKGKVRNLTNFGAFVELEDGIDGLIHISDLSWTKKIRHPGEVVKKGDEIDVVVLNVDRDNRRISLGYKQTQDNPWDFFEDKYHPGALVEGKVVRLIEKGLIVELPDAVDGFVPMSQLAKDNLSKPADAYQIDDTLTLSVIEFNKENKKIVLSEKNAIKQENREAKAAAAAEKAAVAESAAPAEAEGTAAADAEADTVESESAAGEEAEKPKRSRKKKAE
ncbi:MAG TPA: 30S ribosomal protein S1 [bacterium]|nr:30S ribosomal protein S1 [bacterium]